MKIVHLTAGAGATYCGSCLHDDAIARAMRTLDVDYVVAPVFTEPRLEHSVNVASRRVFLGGINVMLQHRHAWLRRVPRFVDGLLNHPRVLRLATLWSGHADTNEIADLTEAMLEGSGGALHKEWERLLDWLEQERPDVVSFSNLWISGAATAIAQRTNARCISILQGDDLLLNDLPRARRERILAALRDRARAIDAFIAYSRAHARKMGRLLDIPSERITCLPIAVDLPVELPERTPRRDDSPPIVGFFARIAPHKGLDGLVDAFLALRRRAGFEHAELHVGGSLAADDRRWFHDLAARVRRHVPQRAFRHVGTLERVDKFAFLTSLDVLCIPSSYEESKALSLLEGLACGTPCVATAHGIHEELAEQLGGMHLVPPCDTTALTDTLAEVLLGRDEAADATRHARQAIRVRHHPERAARARLAHHERLVHGGS
ncbi:MAG: glycosyltransferase family 4 protein [Planctomycetes bacterium]|nr:glycosyltransferase family 4 protein [Planctomycetota bacterium]